MNARSCALTAVAALGVAVSATATVLYQETFVTDDAGWIDRDVGVDMTVNFSNNFGNAAGSLHGLFPSLGTPSVQVDAFRATNTSSSGAFTGNYWTKYTNFTDIAFDFYADDVLPSDVVIRFFGSGFLYFQSLGAQIAAIDTWNTVVASLSYSGSWIGSPSSTDFSNALASVQWVDIQVTRNSTNQQNYYLDNVTINGSSGGGSGPTSAVPEPDTGLIVLCMGALLFGRVKKVRALLFR